MLLLLVGSPRPTHRPDRPSVRGSCGCSSLREGCETDTTHDNDEHLFLSGHTMRHKAVLTLEPHARKYCVCKVRAVRCNLYTHRILIRYQAMFGSFSVPHLALHLATSLPGRKLCMSFSRVHCRDLWAKVHHPLCSACTTSNLYVCMMETRAHHAEPSAKHTQFMFSHIAPQTRWAKLPHTPISWLHTSALGVLNHSPTARNLSSTPFRIVEMWDTPLQPKT